MQSPDSTIQHTAICSAELTVTAEKKPRYDSFVPDKDTKDERRRSDHKADIARNQSISVSYETSSTCSPVISQRLDYFTCMAIHYMFWGVYELAEPEKWQRLGVITGIMERLGISDWHYDNVEDVLWDVLDAESRNEIYDPTTSSISSWDMLETTSDDDSKSRAIYKRAACEVFDSLALQVRKRQCQSTKLDLNYEVLEGASDMACV